MTVYAHIEHGKVRELVTTNNDIKTMYHNSWTFVDVTNVANIDTGWTAKQIQGQWVFAAPTPPTQDLLIKWAMRRQKMIADSGTTVNAGGVTLKVSTDAASLAHLQTLVTMSQFTPRGQFPWTSSSDVIMLSASQVVDLNNQVSAFIQSTYNVLSLMIAAIKNGKIISRSQIKNPPAPVPAWPK